MAHSPQVGVFMEADANYNLALLLGTVDYCQGRQQWEYLFAYRNDISLEQIEGGRPVTGIIAQLAHYPKVGPVAERLRLPLVDVSRDPATGPFSQVLPDDVGVGRSAAEYFVGRGFKHFAFVGFNDSFSQLRQRGFQSIADRAGGSVASFVEGPNIPYVRDSQHKLRRWLKSLRKPVALMCATDVRSREIVLECQRINIRVPEEISIISVDDDESICQLVVPKLSSICLDGRRAGYQTAALLDRMMRGEKVHWQTVSIPPLPIRHRRSSDAYAISDEEVSAALRFIWENAGRNISVEDVANAATIARRSLQVRFRAALGRTVQAEIWRCHIDRAKEMLARSNLPLWQVAERSGFQRSQAMSRMFFRETGMTPRAYRQSFHG
jgi:LacI family transcriptional regulator